MNISHKQPHEFFKDAHHLFKARIVNISKKTSIIAVNTIFCGKFIKKIGNDKILVW